MVMSNILRDRTNGTIITKKCYMILAIFMAFCVLGACGIPIMFYCVPEGKFNFMNKYCIDIPEVKRKVKIELDRFKKGV